MCSLTYATDAAAYDKKSPELLGAIYITIDSTTPDAPPFVKGRGEGRECQYEIII